jgi:hypothetical protein
VSEEDGREGDRQAAALYGTEIPRSGACRYGRENKNATPYLLHEMEASVPITPHILTYHAPPSMMTGYGRPSLSRPPPPWHPDGALL